MEGLITKMLHSPAMLLQACFLGSPFHHRVDLFFKMQTIITSYRRHAKRQDSIKTYHPCPWAMLLQAGLIKKGPTSSLPGERSVQNFPSLFDHVMEVPWNRHAGDFCTCSGHSSPEYLG
jgi:hypothetical protein